MGRGCRHKLFHSIGWYTVVPVENNKKQIVIASNISCMLYEMRIERLHCVGDEPRAYIAYNVAYIARNELTMSMAVTHNRHQLSST